MKFVVLTFLSLQMLVAPLCQASVTCAQEMMSTPCQEMSDFSDQQGVDTSWMARNLNGDPCDAAPSDNNTGPGRRSASCVDAVQVAGMITSIELGDATVQLVTIALESVPGAVKSYALPEASNVLRTNLWLRTQRIRL
jgi:hypothetical protein